MVLCAEVGFPAGLTSGHLYGWGLDLSWMLRQLDLTSSTGIRVLWARKQRPLCSLSLELLWCHFLCNLLVKASHRGGYHTSHVYQQASFTGDPHVTDYHRACPQICSSAFPSPHGGSQSIPGSFLVPLPSISPLLWVEVVPSTSGHSGMLMPNLDLANYVLPGDSGCGSACSESHLTPGFCSTVALGSTKHPLPPSSPHREGTADLTNWVRHLLDLIYQRTEPPCLQNHHPWGALVAQ